MACDHSVGENVLIICVCLFQRVLVANTDFVVDRIRSRLNEANTANLPSEKQSYFYDFLHSTSNDIPEHVVLLAYEFVIVLWLGMY